MWLSASQVAAPCWRPLSTATSKNPVCTSTVTHPSSGSPNWRRTQFNTLAISNLQIVARIRAVASKFRSRALPRGWVPPPAGLFAADEVCRSSTQRKPTRNPLCCDELFKTLQILWFENEQTTGIGRGENRRFGSHKLYKPLKKSKSRISLWAHGAFEPFGSKTNRLVRLPQSEGERIVNLVLFI